MTYSNIYNENFVIKKFGHIKNTSLKEISTFDLEKLILKLSHDKHLVLAMKEVVKSRNTINISEELEKLEKGINTISDEVKQKKVRELTAIPDDFKLNKKMIQYATKNKIFDKNVDKLFDNFSEYYKLKQFKSRDWNQLWETWVDKNVGFIDKETIESKKPNPFEFTAPIKNEKYPRIFINNKDFFIANTVSEQIIELLYNAGFQDESFKEISGISHQECRSPINGQMKTIFYFDEGISSSYFKKSLEGNSSYLISKEEYDVLNKFSSHVKKYLESIELNWYEDYFKKNKTISAKQGYQLTFRTIINPYINEKEILIIKKEY